MSGGNLAQRSNGFCRGLRGKRQNTEADGGHVQVTVMFRGADIVALAPDSV
jgi:hypothetical protein